MNIRDYDGLEVKLTGKFKKGSENFRQGLPCPLIESPERYGWLAAQKAQRILDQELKDYLQEMLPVELDLYLRRQLPIPSSPRIRKLLAQLCKKEEARLMSAINYLVIRGMSPDDPAVKKHDERLKKVRLLSQKLMETQEVKLLVPRTDVAYSVRA